jgi:signal peptidase II
VFDYRKNRWFVPLIVSLVILVSDQVTKNWIVRQLGPEPALRHKSVIGNWFRLVYSQNTGIAFNFFPDMSPFFILTSLLISGLVLYGYMTHLPNRNPFVQLSIGLILGGAMGNTLDRIRVGFVIDFIQIGWWPVFNIADSAITTGAIVLAFYLVLVGEGDEPEQPAPRDDGLLHELLQEETEHPMRTHQMVQGER